MRVLHINGGNLYGGVETLLMTLAREQRLCAEMEPHFALSFEGRLSEELRANGQPVHLLGGARSSQPWTVWRARRRLRELLGGENFDVAVCHMPWAMAMFGGTVVNAGTRLAFWAHGIYGGKHWLERWAKRTRPDVVIANSRFTERAACKLFPDSPHQLIYYPVEARKVQSAERCRAVIRRELGTREDAVVIVQVSRMEAWKGHDLHLAALARLRDLSTPWECWIAGGAQRPDESEYAGKLLRLARHLGLANRIRFLGQRSDVDQLLASADIFCQPNRGPEPFGIVFIEALAAGLPVVTTAIGAATEILDEECGLLAPPDDAAALAEILKRCIESPGLRQAAGQKGPARARQFSDAEVQLGRLNDLLRSVARPAGPVQASYQTT